MATSSKTALILTSTLFPSQYASLLLTVATVPNDLHMHVAFCMMVYLTIKGICSAKKNCNNASSLVGWLVALIPF